MVVSSVFDRELSAFWIISALFWLFACCNPAKTMHSTINILCMFIWILFFLNYNTNVVIFHRAMVYNKFKNEDNCFVFGNEVVKSDLSLSERCFLYKPKPCKFLSLLSPLTPWRGSVEHFLNVLCYIESKKNMIFKHKNSKQHSQKSPGGGFRGLSICKFFHLIEWFIYLSYVLNF